MIYIRRLIFWFIDLILLTLVLFVWFYRRPIFIWMSVSLGIILFVEIIGLLHAFIVKLAFVPGLDVWSANQIKKPINGLISLLQYLTQAYGFARLHNFAYYRNTLDERCKRTGPNEFFHIKMQKSLNFSLHSGQILILVIFPICPCHKFLCQSALFNCLWSHKALVCFVCIFFIYFTHCKLVPLVWLFRLHGFWLQIYQIRWYLFYFFDCNWFFRNRSLCGRMGRPWSWGNLRLLIYGQCLNVKVFFI